MDNRVQALRSSVTRLRAVVGKLNDTQLVGSAYPSEWTIADVLSHLGSGAVIMQRRLDDGLLEHPTPEDFVPGVWDTWNAKSPRSKADDALDVDRALLERIESVTDAERSRFQFVMGPMNLDFESFVGMRLNEHAFHTWDIEVVLDPATVVPNEAATYVVDNLELIARFTAKPTGSTRSVALRTTDPTRTFTISLAPDSVGFETGGNGRQPDLELTAEAFSRLVYGRLDPEHTPSVTGDSKTLEELRRVFPGP
jgi:uncharacterized protein (TIGR03083 family)